MIGFNINLDLLWMHVHTYVSLGGLLMQIGESTGYFLEGFANYLLARYIYKRIADRLRQDVVMRKRLLVAEAIHSHHRESHPPRSPFLCDQGLCTYVPTGDPLAVDV